MQWSTSTILASKTQCQKAQRSSDCKVQVLQIVQQLSSCIQLHSSTAYGLESSAVATGLPGAPCQRLCALPLAGQEAGPGNTIHPTIIASASRILARFSRPKKLDSGTTSAACHFHPGRLYSSTREVVKLQLPEL